MMRFRVPVVIGSLDESPALIAPAGVYEAVSVNDRDQACALTEDDEVRCFGSLIESLRN